MLPWVFALYNWYLFMHTRISYIDKIKSEQYTIQYTQTLHALDIANFDLYQCLTTIYLVHVLKSSRHGLLWPEPHHIYNECSGSGLHQAHTWSMVHREQNIIPQDSLNELSLLLRWPLLLSELSHSIFGSPEQFQHVRNLQWDVAVLIQTLIHGLSILGRLLFCY